MYYRSLAIRLEARKKIPDELGNQAKVHVFSNRDIQDNWLVGWSIDA